MTKTSSTESGAADARPPTRRTKHLLCHARVGHTVKLTSVKGGHQFRARLAAMGLIVGSELKVIRTDPKGPCILALKHSRIVLGRGAAHKVEVEG